MTIAMMPVLAMTNNNFWWCGNLLCLRTCGWVFLDTASKLKHLSRCPQRNDSTGVPWNTGSVGDELCFEGLFAVKFQCSLSLAACSVTHLFVCDWVLPCFRTVVIRRLRVSNEKIDMGATFHNPEV